MSLQIWILTFNRPEALNRLIHDFGTKGYMVNVFSNHPKVQIAPLNKGFINQVIINTLNSEESNSWCARAWNTCMMKAFDMEGTEELILVQDDTDISEDFYDWFETERQKFDFMWGPAGDQWIYLTKAVLQKVGWFDERYIGCYAGDADFLKRVWIAWDRSRISVEDSHNWGFRWNESGISKHIITTYQSKTIDPNYENQHWQFERILGCGGQTSETNPTIKHAQAHFRAKWGVELDNGKPVIESTKRLMPEIDWYPWFSKKHNFERIG